MNSQPKAGLHNNKLINLILNMIISGIKIFGSGAKPPVLEELNATSNGIYTPSDGVDGFNPVEVNVQPSLQAKSSTTTITENGTSTITLEPDSNYDGLSSASVTITTNVTASMPKLVLENGMGFRIYGDVDLGFCDTSRMTSMNTLFYRCSGLTSLDVSKFNTSQVTSMLQMFSGCDALTSLDVSNFDTSKVTDMCNLFSGCHALTSLDLTNFNTSNVKYTNGMFNGCKSLTTLNMKGCNLTNVTNISNMFKGCTALTELRFTDYGDEHWSTDIGDLPKMDLTDWALEDCVNLSYDSLKSIIWSLNLEFSGTCRIGLFNLKKLTDEDIANAAEYGWTLE